MNGVQVPPFSVSHIVTAQGQYKSQSLQNEVLGFGGPTFLPPDHDDLWQLWH